jgi:hypothetical protein
MEMSGYIISLISLIVAIAVTVIVTRYYFHRSINKSLTPYLDFSSQLLSDIDPKVKKDLSIKFQGLEVDRPEMYPAPLENRRTQLMHRRQHLPVIR